MTLTERLDVESAGRELERRRPTLAGLLAEDSSALHAHASDLRDAARALAILALQSERYHTDVEYHYAVDAVLAVVAATGRKS